MEAVVNSCQTDHKNPTVITLSLLLYSSYSNKKQLSYKLECIVFA